MIYNLIIKNLNLTFVNIVQNIKMKKAELEKEMKIELRKK